MKVGIVMPLAGLRGGAEIMLLHLLKANKRTGNADFSILFLEDGPLAHEAKALGYSVTVCSAGKLRQIGRFLRTEWAIFVWLKRERIHYVLSWMSKAHLYAGPVAYLSRVESAWYQHGFSSMDAMERWINRIPAKAIACPSEATRTVQASHNDKVPAIVIYPSVDLEEYDTTKLPSKSAARDELGLPADATVIGIVARLQRWKGIHTFLEAASIVSKSSPGIRFVVVGGPHESEPDYPGELRAQAEKAGIADQVIFAGHQSNVPLWVQSFDILVHASDKEPFGMVIIEGMALGKAVIASREGGPRESIQDGKSGLLVPPQDACKLADAMRRLMTDTALYDSVSKAGLERVKSFGSERLAKEVVGLFIGRGSLQ
ncbi:glycosyltransferase family 4 protein [Cohnella lubricantis]|uniref:Glycosyltransferase family 4 protein n=1 Tax=Cohnella lubricantis TaxID=2163172 RepID=A0A841T9W7_9BACL|nr:glycosyltransferase family 4 protein [Cohnella lubricantis]MBB6676836.1 glycosyltransferase family 4 protein [Cohnella lubricantis]MBP2119416.1 glycosyltransferase involved in cell wall biosynthesis [Cohnella lubricantis]